MTDLRYWRLTDGKNGDTDKAPGWVAWQRSTLRRMIRRQDCGKPLSFPHLPTVGWLTTESCPEVTKGGEITGKP